MEHAAPQKLRAAGGADAQKKLFGKPSARVSPSRRHLPVCVSVICWLLLVAFVLLGFGLLGDETCDFEDVV